MDRWDLGQADPLPLICRKWVQELGFDETTVDVEGGDDRVGIKYTGMDELSVRENELLARWYELPSGLIHQRLERGTWASLPPTPTPTPPKEPPFSCGRSLTLYGFASVHPDPTPVNHPCPHLSARPISYSF